MRRRRGDAPFVVALAILAAGVLALSLWWHTSAPCSAFKYSKAKDVPARCLTNYRR